MTLLNQHHSGLLQRRNSDTKVLIRALIITSTNQALDIIRKLGETKFGVKCFKGFRGFQEENFSSSNYFEMCKYFKTEKVSILLRQVQSCNSSVETFCRERYAQQMHNNNPIDQILTVK